MTATTTQLEASGIGLQMDNRWLWRELDLCVSEPCFIAVTGSSGAGKTSLLRCLSGQLSPSEGTITRGPVTTAVIRQDLQLANGASCLMNALGGCLGRHSFLSTLLSFPSEERSAAKTLLGQFGLSGKENQWASTLSRGERQRLAICRTLLARPSILLADEPVASLDSQWGERVLKFLKETIIKAGGFLICSLHDENQVNRFAAQRLHLDSNLPNGWSLQPIGGEVQI